MWRPGDLVIRREILGLTPAGTPADDAVPWHGRAWLELPVRVVEDTDDHLVTFIPTGTPFTFPDGIWPTPDGVHPWSGRAGWTGHGCLMIQRPGEHHAVWHFWEGPERRFAHWYINLQTAFRRTGRGYDTQDLELDLVVEPDGGWQLKDDEFMEQRVAEGRFTADLVVWIRALAGDLMARLDSGDHWWDPAWADWRPPPEWSVQREA
ncbi:MAG: DUF402 domain-containing protein [Actinomycetota bacterium]